MSSLGGAMMPVPDGHPDVFERTWPVRVGDIDRDGRLRLDAACRHIQDVGQDHLRELGHAETHPLWIVRRTTVDVLGPIEFGEMLRLRRWCAGTSNRWCSMRVRLDGRRSGGRLESEAFWININRATQGPSRIGDDFLASLRRTTDVDRLRWRAHLHGGAREDAAAVRPYPVRVTDIDLFDHVNNAVYWSVVQSWLAERPELRATPLRVSIEHVSPVALHDHLEILQHHHPAGSTDRFGPDLADAPVTTLTYVVGDEVKAVAAVLPAQETGGAGVGD